VRLAYAREVGTEDADDDSGVGRSTGVQSIDRAAAILRVFSKTQPVVGISEMARQTGLSRGTTHRLVSALASQGLLTQVPNSTDYSLGPWLLRLADTANEQLSLETQARPVMAALRDATDETVGLHILDSTPSRRTIGQVESRQALRRSYTDLGVARPPHQGAPSKVLLAHAAAEVRAAVLSALAEAEPQLSVRLRAELSEVAARGYAVSLEERVKGVVAIAMPVWDHRGLAGALSISVPAVRAGLDELVGLVPVLRQATRDLSRRLGAAAAGEEI
jgi:IclR family acetate operon transcriptional repressor